MFAGPAPAPAVIQAAVVAALAAVVHPASVSMTVAAHPYTAAERWDYTRTFQIVVTVAGVNYNVRGHVHYRRARQLTGAFTVPASYVAVPGRYWISGINGWDAQTPGWLVALYNAITALERTNATQHFNLVHAAHIAVV